MVAHKNLFVIDASVIIKWALLEIPNCDEALALRQDFFEEHIELIVPTHCFSEVGNILGRIKPDIAVSFMSFLFNSAIEERALSLNIVTLTFKLMEQYPGVTFYDAAYHALAIQEKGTFISADVKYVKKTRGEGHIMLLKDYPIKST